MAPKKPKNKGKKDLEIKKKALYSSSKHEKSVTKSATLHLFY